MLSINNRPNAISTIPDNTTTKFLLNGTQSEPEPGNRFY
jgi:hypothetical protein